MSKAAEASRKKPTGSRLGFCVPRVLICLAICTTGVFLALLAFAVYPGGNAQAQPQQDQVMPEQVVSIKETLRSDLARDDAAVMTGQPPPPVCNMQEGFDLITDLVLPKGWIMQNNSQPLGTNPGWSQGSSAVFTSQSGAPDSHIVANYANGSGAATLSNWLITPPLTVQNGSQLSFWTRTVDASQYPDRLQIRLSTNGTSADVGSTATSVGDFATLLLDINPTYTITGYPSTWTNYVVTISGIAVPTTGRLAFRYFVENGGPDGANSNYIGIDTVQYSCQGGLPTPAPTPIPVPTLAPIGTIVFSRYNSTSVPPTPTPFEQTSELYQMDSNGANLQQLTFSGTMHLNCIQPKWSFDGTKIVYIEFPFSFPSNYRIVVIGGPHPGTVLSNLGGSQIYPAWSRDGTKIVFGSGTIRTVNEDGSNLTDLGQQGEHPAWSPDGTKIAFDRAGGIWTMNPDGSNPINLTTNDQSSVDPAWSPDGSRIVFASARDGNAEIYVMNADGSNQIRLTNNDVYDRFPSWSPDGTQIAFESKRTGDYAAQIYVMNTDGSNQTRVTDNTYPDGQPHWRWTLPAPTPGPTATPTATPTPVPRTISGRVGNCASPAPTSTPPATPTPPTLPPVTNVLMTLSGSSSGTATTDGSGNYSFTVPTGGTYTVTPSKGPLAPGGAGINNVDVLAIQRHFLLITPIPAGCRLLAADVNANGTVNGPDVLAVQRFFLGLTNGVGSAGQYKFIPANQSYPSISTNQAGQDYAMYVLGDVVATFVNRPEGMLPEDTTGYDETAIGRNEKDPIALPRPRSTR